MLFNSLGFALFLSIVFLAYWFVVNRSTAKQNMLLLIASLFFYGCWDWRFLFLLSFTILLDYITGLKIHAATSGREQKRWLFASVAINIGILVLFKYLNFFAESFSDLIQLFGLQANPVMIRVVLPIGISFYTFHGMSYVFDIYRKKLKPTRNLANYALFVSFFPLLVAGPIERAWHLLPQIEKPRRFDYGKAADGLRQILWGLFKKIVIADSCSVYVNTIFNHSETYSGSTLVLGALFFAFQLYGDFSGYSDIALGTARLLGFELARNFNFPFFSRSMSEFWQRWHISLSSWFRDYVAVPLMNHRNTKWMKVRTTFIIFLLIGLWHGASWTFVAWGLVNALLVTPSLLFRSTRSTSQIIAHDRMLPTWRDSLALVSTFGQVMFMGIFFRAETIHQAFAYLSEICSRSLFRIPEVFPKFELALIFCFMLVEWVGRRDRYAIERFALIRPRMMRHAFYYLTALLIVLFWRDEQAFIYFQF